MATESKMAVVLTPEMLLAVEAGIAQGLKGLCGDVNPRSQVKPDQIFKDLVLDLTLTIPEITIGHDSDRAPTVSIPLLPTLAMLLKHVGKDKAESLNILKQVLTDVLKLKEEASKALVAEMDLEKTVDEIKQEVLKTLTRTPVAKTVKATNAQLTCTGMRQGKEVK